MSINESAENYLETIYVLTQSKELVRSIDVAQALGFSKPSVSRAVKLLRESGHLTVEDSGRLSLTPEGEKLALRTYHRHTVIRDALVALGVEPSIAEQDACRIEHVISEQTHEAIFNHAKTNSKQQ